MRIMRFSRQGEKYMYMPVCYDCNPVTRSSINKYKNIFGLFAIAYSLFALQLHIVYSSMIVCSKFMLTNVTVYFLVKQCNFGELRLSVDVPLRSAQMRQSMGYN